MTARQASKSSLVPAVAYLRKSTKGTRPDGTERQENSIEQQRREVEQLAASSGYRIIRWYVDEGVSGWKQGSQRPQFDRMLREARELRDFKVIVCDDIDRFSRADFDSTYEAMHDLKKSGLEALHCVKQGKYSLAGGSKYDIGTLIKLVIDIHGSNDFSRKLGRRLALTRRNKAREGKRSGGRAPFGYVNDKAGGLKLGEAANVKLVKSIFNRFVKLRHSLLQIANDLNGQGIAPPRGKRWSNQTIKNILQQEAYKGTFVYNRKKSGEFFIVNGKGEVVEAPENGPNRKAWKLTEEGAIRAANTHSPIVSEETWQAAQDRIASFSELRSRRNKRTGEGTYVLTGVLICDHCGGKMYGVQSKKRAVEYRCEGHTRHGKNVCGYHTIREDRILPFILETLKAEVTEVHAELLRPKPEALFASEPETEDDQRLVELQAQLDQVSSKVQLGAENLLLARDPDVRLAADRALASWIAEEKQLKEELHKLQTASKDVDWGDLSQVDLDEIRRWVKWCQDAFPYDRAGAREVLRQLGAEVRLRWTCEEKPWGRKTPTVRKYYKLAENCRFRLGKQSGPLFDRVHQAPAGEPCSCSRGADRSCSRRGRG